MKEDIGSAEYWDAFFRGETKEGTVRMEGKVRPVSTYDRIGELMPYIEGNKILDVGAAHASLCKRIKHAYPEKFVVALDHSAEARNAAGFEPYVVASAYDLPFVDKAFDLLVCTQAMEYMEHDDIFLREAQRVAKKALLSVPRGKMSTWSQQRVYDAAGFKELILRFGEIEMFEESAEKKIIRAKIVFK